MLPHHMDHYAVHVLVKGTLQSQARTATPNEESEFVPRRNSTISRREILAERTRIMGQLTTQYLQALRSIRMGMEMPTNTAILYRRNEKGEEQDFGVSGKRIPAIVLLLCRVRHDELYRFVEDDLSMTLSGRFVRFRYPE